MATKARGKIGIAPEKRIKRLLAKHAGIQHVSMTFGPHGISVLALPNSFHRLVSKRREEAFAARGGSVGIDEATQINADSLAAVARGHGQTMDEALDALQVEIDRHDAPNPRLSGGQSE